MSYLAAALVIQSCISLPLHAQIPRVLSGTVREVVTGRPLIGALVNLIANGDARTTRTDAAGSFAFRNLPDGMYQLSVRQVGYEAQTKAVRVVDGVELNFELTRLELDTLRVRSRQQRIYGSVATAERLQPLINATVQILGTSTGQTKTDSAGHFSYDVQSPGAYLVRGKTEGRGVATLSVTVGKGAGVEVALLLDSFPSPNANMLEMAFADSRERMLRRGLSSAFIPRSVLLATKRPSLLSALLASGAALNGLRLTDFACVFVDGLPKPGFSANNVDPADVEAVEAYSITGDRSGNLSARWPRGAECGDTGYPRASAPRSGSRGRSAPSDIANFIVIWLRH